MKKSKPKSRMSPRRHRKVMRRADAAAEKIERLLAAPRPDRYSRVMV